MVQRAYVVADEDGANVGLGPTPVKVFFSLRREDAYRWNSRAEAQNQCAIFDSLAVKVTDWAEGGNYICTDFKVEEHSPGEFVVYCDGPFTLTVSASTN